MRTGLIAMLASGLATTPHVRAAEPVTIAAPAAVPAPAAIAAPLPVPAPAAAPAPSPSPLSSMRLKLSAGDLPSAESILEVYRRNRGEDGFWLQGLAWLARGALLLDEPATARRYAADVRRRCAARMATGADPARDDSLATALGAAIEVEAQLTARARGRDAALRQLERDLAAVRGPVSLRSRIQKRANLLALEGRHAPELAVEDALGEPLASLAGLRGAPVLLYVFSESCGDCRAQAPTLAAVTRRWRERGLRTVALTRHYDDDRAAEKQRIEQAWADTYRDVGPVPIVVSTASMERYGGSSTPTFVFIDRRGVVRRYTPTRLTEDALEREVAALFE